MAEVLPCSKDLQLLVGKKFALVGQTDEKCKSHKFTSALLETATDCYTPFYNSDFSFLPCPIELQQNLDNDGNLIHSDKLASSVFIFLCSLELL